MPKTIPITVDGYDNGTSWVSATTAVIAGSNTGGGSAKLGPNKRVYELTFTGTVTVVFDTTLIVSMTANLPFTSWGDSRLPKDETTLVEIGRVFLTSGEQQVSLKLSDVASLASVLENEKYDGNLGLVFSQEASAWTNIENGKVSLSVEMLDYFTGLHGIHDSRPMVCPKSGIRLPSAEAVEDGWLEGQLVHPDFFDPEDDNRRPPPDPLGTDPEDDPWAR